MSENLPKNDRGNSDDNRKDEVEIFINNTPYEIHRGSQSVAELKTKGNVPLADVLEQLMDNSLKELDDNGRVTIKGGEKFFSHPRTSSSS